MPDKDDAKNGDQAFPLAHDIQPPPGFERVVKAISGMSLLDYYAGKALNGMLSDKSVLNVMTSGPRGSTLELANCAFDLAEAMVQVRKERGHG